MEDEFFNANKQREIFQNLLKIHLVKNWNFSRIPLRLCSLFKSRLYGRSHNYLSNSYLRIISEKSQEGLDILDKNIWLKHLKIYLKRINSTKIYMLFVFDTINLIYQWFGYCCSGWRCRPDMIWTSFTKSYELLNC